MTVASEIRSRDPRQFAFAKGKYGYVLRHLTKEQPITGVEVPLKKILVFSHGALDGNPYGRPLGRVLFWSNFFKKNGIRFWLRFVERFASPKPTGKYPRGATPQQINELRAALAAMANETEIAIPDGMLIEYLEAAQSGTIDTYESLCKFMDAQISKAIRGETGTADQSGSGGSRARDEVANSVRTEKAKAVSDSLSATFNRLAAWITEFNVPGAIAPKIWRVFDEQEDLNSRANRDKVLFDLGYRITPEAVASVYGESYEQAGGDDKEPALISSLGVGGVQALTGLLTQAATGQLPKENAIAVLVSVFGIDEAAAAKMVPDAPEQTEEENPLDQLFGGQDGSNSNGNVSGGTDGGNNPVGAGTVFSEDAGDRTVFAEPNKDAADLIADKARPLVQDAIAPWLDQVRNFVEQSASLEEIRDGLVDLWPEMDDKAFTEAMGQAMLLSDLAGREELLDEDADVAFAEAIEAALSGTLDFAAKASGKKPNCNPAKSHFCQSANGRGSCVPLSKKCKFKSTGTEKAAADWAEEKVSKKTKGKTQSSAKEQLDPILHDFYDFAKKGGTLTPTEIMLAEAALGVETLNSYKLNKIAKLKKDKLSELEAAAVENYIGPGYAEMNAALYDPVQFQEGFGSDGWTEQMAINKAAVNGLKKIDKVKESEILDLAEKHGIDYQKGDPLVRTLKIKDPEALSQFIQKHQNAEASGDPLVVEQFLSTTFKQDGLDYFAAGANVTIKVKAKLDGKGNGILVDKYKNKAFESEVLYPPMTEFKIAKVTKTKDGTPAGTETIEVAEYTDKYQKLNTALKNIQQAAILSSFTGNSLTGALGKSGKASIIDLIPEGVKMSDLNNKTKLEQIKSKLGVALEKESEKTKLVKTEIATEGSPDSYLIEYEEI